MAKIRNVIILKTKEQCETFYIECPHNAYKKMECPIHFPMIIHSLPTWIDTYPMTYFQ